MHGRLQVLQRIATYNHNIFSACPVFQLQEDTRAYILFDSPVAKAARADIFTSLNVAFVPRDFAQFLKGLITLKKSWQTKAVMLYEI